MFDHTARCREIPRLDAAARTSFSEQVRSIRRRAAGVEEPTADDSDARMERIARLRTAIAEGRYHLSADELAQKLIAHMLANRPTQG